MPKINTTIANFSGIEVNESYIITEVEQKDISFEQNGKQTTKAGIVVTMKSINTKDETIYSETLWLTDTATLKSKLGSFVSAFETFFSDYNKASETDNWLNHTIKVRDWRNKKREIEVLS